MRRTRLTPWWRHTFCVQFFTWPEAWGYKRTLGRGHVLSLGFVEVWWW
jgi:hypothetical protein